MYDLIAMVKGRVRFEFFRDGCLHYVTDSGFKFTVPVKDTGTATFFPEDKGLYLMRWLRPAVAAANADSLDEVQARCSVPDNNQADGHNGP